MLPVIPCVIERGLILNEEKKEDIDICEHCFRLQYKKHMGLLYSVHTGKLEYHCIECISKYDDEIQTILIKLAYHERYYTRYNNEREYINMMNNSTKKQYKIINNTIDIIKVNKELNRDSFYEYIKHQYSNIINQIYYTKSDIDYGISKINGGI